MESLGEAHRGGAALGLAPTAWARSVEVMAASGRLAGGSGVSGSADSRRWLAVAGCGRPWQAVAVAWAPRGVEVAPLGVSLASWTSRAPSAVGRFRAATRSASAAPFAHQPSTARMHRRSSPHTTSTPLHWRCSSAHTRHAPRFSLRTGGSSPGSVCHSGRRPITAGASACVRAAAHAASS